MTAQIAKFMEAGLYSIQCFHTSDEFVPGLTGPVTALIGHFSRTNSLMRYRFIAFKLTLGYH